MHSVVHIMSTYFPYEDNSSRYTIQNTDKNKESKSHLSVTAMYLALFLIQ